MPKFPMPGFDWENEITASVREIDGRQYHFYLAVLKGHILYRAADRDSVEQTFYVTEPPPVERSEELSYSEWHEAYERQFEAFFRKQGQEKRNGRLALYTCPAARNGAAPLFFAPDGTGKFLDHVTANKGGGRKGQTIEFLWDGSKYGIATFAGILTCEWEALLPLCEEVFMQQIWPRMEDPYISHADLPDEPVRCTCGSRYELELITRCICHADRGLFKGAAEDHPVIVTYTADTPQQRGGLDEGQSYLVARRGLVAGKLCQLAFTHNAFQGQTWEYKSDYGRLRRSCYQQNPAQVVVEAAPPSAHERAEALLTLYEWLEGKVTQKKRQQYCGLDAPAVTENKHR